MKIAASVGWVAAAFMAAAPGWGQDAARDYPKRPVRWIVPFTPGASNDVIGRLVAGKLSESMGQQFIVDNRPGAGGIVGAETVARASPDGYTLILANPGPNVNNVLLRKHPSYQMSDFVPIVWMGYAPFYVMASLSFAPRTAREIVDYARARTSRWPCSSFPPGSTSCTCPTRARSSR
jgi:tripartite-type tricarboxylate transporter receptor subunit TctC